MKRSFHSGALAAAAIALSLGASAAYAETPSWCGPKKATLALLDGFGGNSAREADQTVATREEGVSH